MRKVNLIPNIITAVGLAFGLFVIFRIVVADVLREDFFHVMVICSGFLMFSALADFFDGAIARLISAESDFGSVFDSLCDAVTFGVAPSVMLLRSLRLDPGSELLFFVMAGTLIFSTCGVLRLVRFNVSKPAREDVYNKNFTGMPIPAAALAAVSINLFFISPKFASWYLMGDKMRGGIMVVIMVLLGYLMVSRWKFPSLKSLRFRVKSINLAFIAVIFSIIALYGIMHHFALIFLLLCWSYPLTALVLSAIRLSAGRKSRTLEDFEPEPDPEE